MPLLQLPLDMLPGGSIAINDRLSMRICDDTLVYFHYLDPVYSHPFPDVPHRDRAIAMFLDFGTATASQLARAHGLSLRTVGRALKARRQGLHDSFPPPPAARARTVLKDPPQRQRAADMLLSGSSLRQVADALGVSHQTVFRYRLAGRLPGVPGGLAADPPPAADPPRPAAPAAEQAPQAVSRSARNQLDAAAPLGMATCNVAGRMAASIGGPGPAPPRFEAVETVARGGVLTALPALLQAGLLSDRDRLGPVAGYYGQRAVLLLQAFLLLARQWVSAAADDVATLFVDGHVQVYHGQANLPKHFVSRDRLGLLEPWLGAGQRRKARSQAGKPPAGRRQPSIVTTHPTMPAEQVAGLLRSRWSQEANFKWMRQEYGLDTLAEHATEEVAGGTRVVNPGSREIGKGLDRLKARSGRLRRRQAQLGRNSTPKARAERQRVKAEIQAVEKDIAGLERARSSTPSHVLAGELPEELRLRALPGARRGLLDGLRMIACRAETAMASVLAPHLGKPAEVRALARALLQSDASLRPDPAAGTLTVQLLHTACRAHDEAVAPLIEQLNRTKTIYPGTSQRLVYEILPGPAPESPSGPSKN